MKCRSFPCRCSAQKCTNPLGTTASRACMHSLSMMCCTVQKCTAPGPASCSHTHTSKVGIHSNFFAIPVKIFLECPDYLSKTRHKNSCQVAKFWEKVFSGGHKNFGNFVNWFFWFMKSIYACPQNPVLGPFLPKNSGQLMKFFLGRR